MTNAAIMNQEMAINKSIASMEELMADKAAMAAETLDESYEAFSKHVAIARENFLHMVSVMTPLIE